MTMAHRKLFYKRIREDTGDGRDRVWLEAYVLATYDTLEPMTIEFDRMVDAVRADAEQDGAADKRTLEDNE